jgi:hypothetical protein
MKENELWFGFYFTEAVINRERTKSNYNLRHLVICMAVHGFNRKISQTKTASASCLIQIADCKGRTTSLSSYGEEN